MPSVTLILGGARSGKSAYAEKLAGGGIYIATAEAGDSEMAKRIALHQARRGDGWKTLEVPLKLPDAIRAQQGVVLVDCLTLWLSNLMHAEMDVTEQTMALLDALRGTQASVILVSNEVGQGIVPDNALARRFRDEAGILHQRIAEAAHRVVWIVAGIPTYIKGAP